MISLHHFGVDGEQFFLNPELIIKIESKPDTIVHLITGQELYVRENPRDIVELVREWRSSLFDATRLIGDTQKDDE